MTAHGPDDVVAQLMADGLLEPSDARRASVAAHMVRRIHETAYSMTVDDAANLVTQADALLKEARKVKAGPELIGQYGQGVLAARAFLRFRKHLERLRV